MNLKTCYIISITSFVTRPSQTIWTWTGVSGLQSTPDYARLLVSNIGVVLMLSWKACLFPQKCMFWIIKKLSSLGECGCRGADMEVRVKSVGKKNFWNLFAVKLFSPLLSFVYELDIYFGLIKEWKKFGTIQGPFESYRVTIFRDRQIEQGRRFCICGKLIYLSICCPLLCIAEISARCRHH